MEGFLTLLASIIAFLLAIIIHESSHAFVADKLGDDTARSLGRVSLNPIRHIDPIGTILVPGFLLLTSHLSGIPFVFGWAKPVPVNPYNFRYPTRDRLLVALAGPVSNFLLAVGFSFFLRIVPGNTYLPYLLQSIVVINLLLMMFNLLPLPPLDGSALLPYIFRGQAAALYWVEQQGFYLLFGFLILDSLVGGRILDVLVRLPVTFLASLLLGSGSSG